MTAATTALLEFLINNGVKVAPVELSSQKCSDAHTHQKQTNRK